MPITKTAYNFLRGAAKDLVHPVNLALNSTMATAGDSSLGGTLAGSIATGPVIHAAGKLGDWLAKIPRYGRFAKPVAVLGGYLAAGEAFNRAAKLGDRYFPIWKRKSPRAVAAESLGLPPPPEMQG